MANYYPYPIEEVSINPTHVTFYSASCWDDDRYAQSEAWEKFKKIYLGKSLILASCRHRWFSFVQNNLLVTDSAEVVWINGGHESDALYLLKEMKILPLRQSAGARRIPAPIFMQVGEFGIQGISIHKELNFFRKELEDENELKNAVYKFIKELSIWYQRSVSEGDKSLAESKKIQEKANDEWGGFFENLKRKLR